jgi:hypothetical protein
MRVSSEQQTLRDGVERVEQVLRSHGFTHTLQEPGISSGGPFAVAEFRRGKLNIGLIVRNKDQLGCPNYSVGQGFAGHQDLIAELGHTGEEQLVSGSDLSYVGKDDQNPFDALIADLQEFIVPWIEKSEESFLAALRRAVARHHERLGF